MPSAKGASHCKSLFTPAKHADVLLLPRTSFFSPLLLSLSIPLFRQSPFVFPELERETRSFLRSLPQLPFLLVVTLPSPRERDVCRSTVKAKAERDRAGRDDACTIEGRPVLFPRRQ